MDTAAKIFFSMSRFAVAGASANPSKFGYKSVSAEEGDEDVSMHAN